MNKALLDTDTLSEIGKSRDAHVADRARAYLRSFGRYTLSVVRVMEIIGGFRRVQAAARLDASLATLPRTEILPFDQPAAVLAGRISGDLIRAGRPIGTADPMIAAIAIVHGLELVMGNTAHFERVLRLGYPLTLANWRSVDGDAGVGQGPA